MEQMFGCAAEPALRADSSTKYHQHLRARKQSSRHTQALRFLVLLSLTMASAMALGDFIKSGGWDKAKFRDVSGADRLPTMTAE